MVEKVTQKIIVFFIKIKIKNKKLNSNQNQNQENNVALYTALATSIGDEWILDSGASKHMTYMHDILIDINPCSEKIYLGDNSVIKAEGIGKFKIFNETVGDALYVLDLRKNLLSCSQLTKDNFKISLTKDKWYIKDQGKTII